MTETTNNMTIDKIMKLADELVNGISNHDEQLKETISEKEDKIYVLEYELAEAKTRIEELEGALEEARER